ncbi:MAG: hypothetical protein AAF517_27225, partial [Planctomycetota bacterium]
APETAAEKPKEMGFLVKPGIWEFAMTLKIEGQETPVKSKEVILSYESGPPGSGRITVAQGEPGLEPLQGTVADEKGSNVVTITGKDEHFLGKFTGKRESTELMKGTLQGEHLLVQELNLTGEWTLKFLREK